ncbi:MAG: xanthine dehydrogenase [Xanthobacteraceae bacterium]|nr:xanthine dehydrogenase [Xanthobacteraceae bacterium]
MAKFDPDVSVIGQSVARLEDPPLVRGQGRFAADVSFPGQLHMRIVRSSMPHGRIVSIDTTATLQMPGVVAVWTVADIADIPPIGFRDTRVEQLEPYRQPVLADGVVRYVGEPVAAVFADDAYRAEDAADAVIVEFEEWPSIMTADVTAEFSPGHSTEAMVVKQGYGDIEAAFGAAYAVVELDLSVGRHSGVPLETRGAIARHDAVNDIIELHGAAKVPHRNREQLARMLDRPLSSIHLFEGHVGGGFGVRGELYPEDVLVCLASLRLGQPVKWIEDRREHLIATNHSRQQRHRIKAAVDRGGQILGLDDVFFHDQGAYVRTHGARVLEMVSGMLPGPYRIPAYRIAGHYRLTNKTPCATYRSPGRYEGTFVRERMMDAVASRLGLDRVEVRRRNLISQSEMPYERDLQALGDDVIYDSGDYAGLLDRALDRIGWPALLRQVEQRRHNGELVGLGLSMFVEKSGLGPKDGVFISVDPQGDIEVVTGGASLGQGFETVIAQICAGTLGCDYRRIRVIHGQTNRIANGIGAHATRATVMTGSATQVAAWKLRDRALDAAAELLQADRADLTIADGEVRHKNQRLSPCVALGDISAWISAHPSGTDAPGGLNAEGWFHTEHMNYPYGVHIALVKVDPSTFAVKVERYLIAYDVGRAVNPMMVEGQLVGGLAQGLGGALFEEFLYDDRGEPLSVTFADYLIPTLHEIPAVEVLLTEDAPSPKNPLGIKGAGEGGVNGAGAAIASAIDDAIQCSGAVTALPVTPARLMVLMAAAPKNPAAKDRSLSVADH